MKRYRHSSKGFTIIELLFATLVFSVVLLMCLTALVQIGRLYYKGITTSQTQDATRSILDEISQAIQFTGDSVTTPSLVAGPDIPVTGGSATANAIGFFCIGSTRYSYVIDRQQSDNPSTNVTLDRQIRHVLWADVMPACAGATGIVPANLTLSNPSQGSLGTNGRELVGANMRINRLKLISLSPDNSTWQVQLSVDYGDEDLLTVYPEDLTRKVCKGSQVGTQFCAISELSTIVKRRVL